jgi:aspartate-semialdehyde dehydrogenase
VSREFAPRAVAAGAVVIDKSSAFRMDPDVPLVVPEVNPEALEPLRAGRPAMVASPGPATIALALVLAPLGRRWGIERVLATTIYGATAAGRRGLEEQQQQTISIFNQEDLIIEKFPRQSAFNIFPEVGGFVNASDSQAERELMEELPRVLGTAVPAAVTAVQAPVWCGLAAAVNVELQGKPTAEEVRDVLLHSGGLAVLDEPEAGLYPDTLLAWSGKRSSWVESGKTRPGTAPSNCGFPPITSAKDPASTWFRSRNGFFRGRTTANREAATGKFSEDTG